LLRLLNDFLKTWGTGAFLYRSRQPGSVVKIIDKPPSPKATARRGMPMPRISRGNF
jgi:hypothetical protein